MRKDVVYHIIFWLVLYSVMVGMDKGNESSYFILAKELVNLICIAAVVYINILYLFPQYLNQRNLWWHIGSLALLSLLITPIRTLAMYLVYANEPDIQGYFIFSQKQIFFSSFFIGITSTIYSIMSDWLKNQRESKELRNRTLQSELNFLKSQINPHFLFNTLNNLYALTLKKSDLAPEIVLKLSEMMRYMLYECNESEVPLQKEVNYLKNYLELEKLRQGKKFKISFELNGDIINQKIAPLIFIPFIENSFKHGVSNQISEGFVDIKMDIHDEEIIMSIENSKAPALPSPNAKKSGGIGLVNVKRRLNILYPEKYLLNISDNPNTYRVDLSLQLLD